MLKYTLKKLLGLIPMLIFSTIVVIITILSDMNKLFSLNFSILKFTI